MLVEMEPQGLHLLGGGRSLYYVGLQGLIFGECWPLITKKIKICFKNWTWTSERITALNIHLCRHSNPNPTVIKTIPKRRSQCFIATKKEKRTPGAHVHS